MAKLNTRKYLIYGSIAAIVGVIGYYIWRDSKKPEEKPKDDGGNEDGGKDGGLKDGNVTDNKGKGNVPPASITKNPFSTKKELDLFQTWVYNVKGDKDILGASKIDGLWGGASAAAWDKYGEEYKKYLGGSKPDTPPVSGNKPTTQQAQENKKSMDALVFSFIGNTAATPMVDSTGRILKAQFHITWGSIKDYKIVFFEKAKGTTKPYFYIKENSSNKLIREGSWEYLNNTPKFIPTAGKYAGKIVKGTSVLACLKLLMEERLVSSGGVIKWGEY